MVSYDFYVNTYLGSAIPEKAFAGAAARAARALEKFKRIYRVESSGTESEAMAVCAMAEAVHSFSGRRSGVTSATVGGVSVRYDSSAPEKALDRILYQKAAIFLDIYRGRSL